MRHQRVDTYLLVALLLLGAALKFCWLGVNELSGDEPFTVFWAQQDMRDLMAMFAGENNPPLYFVIMKAWSSLTPLDPVWLRIPSATFSVLAVWPLFLLARRHLDAWAALTTCLLFTFCNEHYSYAHEVRGYGLLTLLAVLGMWQVDRAARSAPRAMFWLVVSNTLLLYTHFLGWGAIGIQLLSILLINELRKALRAWLNAMTLTIILFLPYGYIFLQRIGHSVTSGTWLVPPTWEEPYNMLWRWSNAPVIVLAFLGIIGYALWRTHAKESAMRIGLIWAGIPLLGLFFLSFMVPLYLDRYLIWAAPGFALLVTASVSHVARNITVVRGGMIILCCAMLVTFTPWKDNGLHPSRVVAQVSSWDPVEDGSLTILPHWYVLTFVGAQELGLYRDPYAMEAWKNMSAAGIGGIDPRNGGPDGESDSLAILVDAGSQLSGAGAPAHAYLRSHYSRIDSVEADKKVWVYRFRR